MMSILSDTNGEQGDERVTGVGMWCLGSAVVSVVHELTVIRILIVADAVLTAVRRRRSSSLLDRHPVSAR